MQNYEVRLTAWDLLDLIDKQDVDNEHLKKINEEFLNKQIPSLQKLVLMIK